jgi:predicted anti-sigma-YlaC factor YlaD
MNWDDQRCYLEEELLLHVLNDEHPDEKIRISNHLASCRSCKDVFDELVEAERAIRSWTVEDLPAESRESMKMEIMQHIRQDPALFRVRYHKSYSSNLLYRSSDSRCF